MSRAQQFLIPAYGGSLDFLIRDEFSDARAAGAVNVTAATPGPGTRVVVDTQSKLTITGGLATFGANAANGDPGLWYDAQTRAAGLAALIQLNRTSGARIELGWSTTSGAIPLATNSSFWIGWLGTNDVLVRAGASLLDSGLDIANATDYQFVNVQRSTGSFYAAKGGALADWTLLWIENSHNVGTTYPLICSGSVAAAYTSDYIRVAQLAAPWSNAYGPATNAAVFTGANGTALSALTNAVGGVWTHDSGIWDVQTNAARGSPADGSDVIVNGDFANWTGDDPDDWTATEVGGADITEVAAGEAHADAPTPGGEHLNIYKSDENNPIALQSILTVGGWYRVVLDINTFTSGQLLVRDGGGTFATYTTSGTKTVTHRANGALYMLTTWTNPTDVTIASNQIYPLTLSELISSVADSALASCHVMADLTLTAGTQAGVVMCLDSAASPANFILAYHDGTNAHLEKCVAGTYTSLIDTAATYGAADRIVAIKDGNSVSLYYNDALISTTQTIADAGIVDNTIHGIFSTHADNRIDNFQVYPRDLTGAAKAQLDMYSA